MIPLVSIIIPTWNTAQVTKKCVETIKKHLNKDSVEVVVVDNGSTDETEKLFSKDKTIKYVKSKENLGFSRGNNLGREYAKGRYLFFLNSDMEMLDDKLLKMIDYLESNDQIGVIGPKFLYPDHTPQPSVIPPQNELNAFKQFWLNKPTYSIYTPTSTTPISVWAISGGALLISSKLFDEIGGWPTNYFMYFEELDLLRRVRNLGKQIFYYPEMQVVHHHGLSGRKLASAENQWRRLIPGSKQYFGVFRHYLINFIIWSGQKWQKIFLRK